MEPGTQRRSARRSQEDSWVQGGRALHRACFPFEGQQLEDQQGDPGLTVVQLEDGVRLDVLLGRALQPCDMAAHRYAEGHHLSLLRGVADRAGRPAQLARELHEQITICVFAGASQEQQVVVEAGVPAVGGVEGQSVGGGSGHGVLAWLGARLAFLFCKKLCEKFSSQIEQNKKMENSEM